MGLRRQSDVGLFGEVWAPSPNDLANTTLGGITLGEMLFRFSSLTLDNEATGSNRVVREVGAGLINPVRGFNRLVRGEDRPDLGDPARLAPHPDPGVDGRRLPPILQLGIAR